MSNLQLTLHIPVMPEEVLKALEFNEKECRRESLYVDGTLGAGGHSELMMERYPHLILLGIEQDVKMLERAKKRLHKYLTRAHLVNANYSELSEQLSKIPKELRLKLSCSSEGLPYVDRMLLDLGISSDQLNDSSIGLSFMIDAPLDMRLSPNASLTAAELLNTSSEGELEKIFIIGGVGRSSRQLAKKIIKRRPINTTKQFASVCEEIISLHRPKRESGKKHPATVPFQAMRIAVNKEFESIKSVLNQAFEVLSPKGRLAVISFHSLEDRLVTQAMRQRSRSIKIGHRKLPQTISEAGGKLLTPQAVLPSATELKNNPRARSARLRVYENH